MQRKNFTIFLDFSYFLQNFIFKGIDGKEFVYINFEIDF